MQEEGLVVDDLHRSYGDVQALAGVGFTVHPGALHGFVGANGAGKTTTMRIAVGIERADRGSVRFAGRSIDDEARRRLGYLPEERGLYPDMRVAEQVVFLGQIRGMEAGAAARRTDELLELLGLTERRDDPTSELSLGNQQRVQLAGTLVHGPDLLLLDEPFSGLDPIAADVMADALRAEADRGVPVLFSSHQLDLVERLCEHVTIIRDGRLVADGRIDELRHDRAGRRLAIELDGDHPDWAGAPGVLDADHDGATATLQLADDADDQHLLDLAREAGRVRRFTPVVPSLADLYREVTQ